MYFQIDRNKCVCVYVVKFRSLRLNATSRIVALLAFSLFPSLWEEIGRISFSHLSRHVKYIEEHL